MKLRTTMAMETADFTISRLSINGAFECFTLEDEWRAVKVPGETRIPAGVFPVKLRTFGGFHERYAKRFPGMHVGMLEITGVPNFSDVLFHIGNTDEDTRGCLLVGQQMNEAGSLGGSELAYRRFYPRVAAALLSGQEVLLEVVR